jgi:hypothetical protein
MQCFYCDRRLTWDNALLVSGGKTACQECYLEFEGSRSLILI